MFVQLGQESGVHHIFLCVHMWSQENRTRKVHLGPKTQRDHCMQEGKMINILSFRSYIALQNNK
jgi:hypothetical protein